MLKKYNLLFAKYNIVNVALSYSTGITPVISKDSGRKRLTKVERLEYKLDDYLKQVLVGNILGDVHMRRFSNKANSRIIFRQGSINKEYLLHLYDLFKDFVVTPPVWTKIVNKSIINTNSGEGKKNSRYNISFATLSLPCFNELYELFYIDGIKKVPLNISELLTDVSLALRVREE